MSLPTFAFLSEALSGRRRIHRWRDPVLLAVRCGLAASVALAFAMPYLPSEVGEIEGGRVARVVVLDRSLSMNHASGPENSFRQGTRLAAEALGRASRQDYANVVLADASPSALLPKPAPPDESLREALIKTEGSFEKADLGAALSLASEQLEKTGLKNREVTIVSDFQRSNWADAHLDMFSPETRIVFLDLSGDDRRENMAITGLRTDPAIARAGRPITLVADVWNSGRTMKKLPVSLEGLPGGKRVAEVVVPPESSAHVRFSASFERPGVYRIEASMPRDSLPADDHRFLAADVRSAMRVLLISSEERMSSRSASYFVWRALDPGPSGSSELTVAFRSPEAVREEDLKRADTTILVHTPSLPATFMPLLANHIREGGALIVFLLENSARNLAALQRSLPSGEDLPFLPTSWIDLRGKGKGYVTLAEARFESPLLRAFRDLPDSALGEIRFSVLWNTTEPARRAEVLLRFEDGTPAAARSAVGAGSVLLCNMTPRPDGGDLVKSEAFPPLLHEFVKGMARAERIERETFAGENVVLSLPEGAGAVRVTGPGGLKLNPEPSLHANRATVRRAERPGFYTAVGRGEMSATVAVNVDPDESDLRTIDPRELKRATEGPAVIRANPESWEAITNDRPLWPAFAVAALLLLLAEGILVGPPLRRKSSEA